MEKTTRNCASHKARNFKLKLIPLIVLLGLMVWSNILHAQPCPMTCHNVNLSLDTIVGGSTQLVPEDLLSNPASCPGGVFTISLFDPAGNEIGDTVDCRWVGYTLIGKVTDSITGNSCWAKVKIEDKAGPNLNCINDTISCFDLTDYNIGLDRFPAGQARDNCGIKAKVSISMICIEYPCTDTEFVGLCIRTVIATDKWGLTATCQDSFWIARDTLANLVGPRDTVLDCHVADTIAKDANGNPLPQRINVPTIRGNPVWPNFNICKILSRYTDTNYPICGKSRKIRRQWTVVDWCTLRDTVMIQWIKIQDTTDPVVPDFPILNVNVGPHDCNAPVDIMKTNFTDCSGIKEVFYLATIFHSGQGGSPVVINGYLIGPKTRIYLPTGTHEIHIFVTDSCLNTTEKILIVNVGDLTPPTPVCDEFTATTLDPVQCWARIYAEDLDNGSHDNCCENLYFSVAHMDTITKYHDLLVARIKSKFGEAKYQQKIAFFELLIDRWINCFYFDDFIDLGSCGRQQLILRVYEACKVPLYDPHVYGDSKHSFYCKAAYTSVDGYSTDQGIIDQTIADILGNVPGYLINLSFNIAPKNYNDCMVWVNVADKQAPTCNVQSEKFAYCDGVPYQLVLTTGNNGNGYGYGNGKLLGCFDANGIYDTAYLKLDQYDNGVKVDPYTLFDYPIFKDNCGDVKVDTVTSGSLNNCGAGTLLRTWTGTDQCGLLTTSCSEKLRVLHRSDFEILFPKDLDTSCISNPISFNNPTGENYPKVFDDDCEHIGISFQDQRFDIATGACYKIVRTWKIIDWCVYDPNQHYRGKDYIVDTSAEFRAVWDKKLDRFCQFRFLKDNGDGVIVYAQIIKVINNIAPTIARVDSIITCAGGTVSCLGHVKFKMSATDDCTPSGEIKWTVLIDSFNNGSINRILEFTGAMATIDGDFPVGKHKITFIAKDLCGNETRRENIVDVGLCKKPTPYLLNGLAVDLMPIDNNRDGIFETGMVVIWAQDFDAGSTAGCGQAIVAFSFSSDTSNKFRTYTCDSLGQRFVNVWVTDSYGNQDFARTYILIQDNNHVCSPGPQALKANISGKVKTEEQFDVEKVNVILDGSAILPFLTKSDGSYAFTNMPVGGSYKVMPKKDVNPMNGVSTLDLLLIQKHILGILPIKSPYKLIAADINKSNDISTVDLVELRKLILGLYEKFPTNESWRFIPKGYIFKNPNNPFDGGFPEYQSIPAFHQNAFIDFVGVKIGDVNSSVTANQLLGTELRSPGEELVLTTENISFKAHQTIHVPIYATDLNSLQGFQFTLSFNTQTLKFEKIIPGTVEMNSSNFGIQKANEGMITASWTTLKPNKNSDLALFTLSFTTRQRAQLQDKLFVNSSITKAEAYNSRHELMGVKLQIGQSAEPGTLILLQNVPNPYTQETNIGYRMINSGTALLSIYDLNGKLIKQLSLKHQKGYNEVKISKGDLNVSGVLYYQLQAPGFTATKKMVVLE